MFTKRKTSVLILQKCKNNTKQGVNRIKNGKTKKLAYQFFGFFWLQSLQAFSTNGLSGFYERLQHLHSVTTFTLSYNGYKFTLDFIDL